MKSVNIITFTKKFVEKYQGIPVDEDNAFGSQCVDIPKMFFRELGMNGNISAGGSAYKYAKPNGYISQYFAFNEVNSINDLRIGDVVIWDNNSRNVYGHVAVCSNVKYGTSFEVLEQNGFTPKGVSYIKDYYNLTGGKGLGQVLGVLRIKPKYSLDNVNKIDIKYKQPIMKTTKIDTTPMKKTAMGVGKHSIPAVMISIFLHILGIHEPVYESLAESGYQGEAATITLVGIVMVCWSFIINVIEKLISKDIDRDGDIGKK